MLLGRIPKIYWLQDARFIDGHRPYGDGIRIESMPSMVASDGNLSASDA